MTMVKDKGNSPGHAEPCYDTAVVKALAAASPNDRHRRRVAQLCCAFCVHTLLHCGTDAISAAVRHNLPVSNTTLAQQPPSSHVCAAKSASLI